jgi:hypothetical protein
MNIAESRRKCCWRPDQHLVKTENIYNTLEKLIERVGLKTIEPYFQ